MSGRPFVIFAEDDHEDWGLIQDALEECRLEDSPIWERCLDGRALLDRLRDSARPTPDLIMLDLRMPRMDGAEALDALKADPALKHIPVVVLTTSKSEADVFMAYHKGASSYVVKPVSYDAIKESLRALKHYWTTVARVPKNGAPR